MPAVLEKHKVVEQAMNLFARCWTEIVAAAVRKIR
jgi:hypothetical protein